MKKYKIKMVNRAVKSSGGIMLISKKKIQIFILMIFSILILFTSGCKDKYKDLNLSVYKYRDTKNLVKFVYDASLVIEKDGMKSLGHFRENRDFYNTKDHYLYIYDMNGVNIYHAGMKHLEGKDLGDITDKNGKKITPLVLEALSSKNNPHAWVHYTWWEPGKFYPVPKSSCHFKVRTPEGKELYVGGGMNYPQEETEFIRIVVDDAVELIKDKGHEAFAEISNPISQFNYRDVRVFVFKSDGSLLISPVLNDTMSQIHLLDCVDETGHKPFEKALKDIKQKDNVWEVFMAKSRFKRKLIKKSLYIRKTVLDGDEIFVAAITDLPEPP